MSAPSQVVQLSKNTKFQSRNPIAQALIERYFCSLSDLVGSMRFESLLEVGCGEGVVLHRLARVLTGRTRVVGLDIDPEEVEVARRNLPWAQVLVGDGSDLPFEQRSFDLVLCCEVLEHVDDPSRVLRELSRVASGYVLLSVPREPLWCIMNMCRGAYIRGLGNTPGHVNHWSLRAFRRLVSRHFEIVAQRTPLPWVMVLARVRDT